jgi:hypothetical protein
LPKPPRENTSLEREGNKRDDITTPKKLKIAPISEAFFIERAPEPTEVAMAEGASVNPLTKTTPRDKIKARGVKKSLIAPPKNQISLSYIYCMM